MQFNFNPRKLIAYFFAVILFILIFYYLARQIQFSEFGLASIPFLIIEFVIILIILSDFNVLRFGLTESIYVWIEYPNKETLKKLETLNEILNFIHYNYNAKKYMEETNNFKIKVINVMDDFLILDTRNVFENIGKGLKFALFFNDTFELDSSDATLIPSEDIAIVEIIYAGKLSKGKIIKDLELTSRYKAILENIKKGQLEGVNAFLKVKLDEDFENTSSEELNKLTDLIYKIKLGGIK